ncbi:glycerophosphodiester phosphodiesterase family protein [Metasolibacillus sp.]|uniref:glycerophosphodiester phosphodiesterase family protein n=1 Tax=Metasolibacillus sp. TaxID=2703680 RepID=UPI0025FA1340|nr:glycerophosphodiester phosphodiesterase family protein [Metasolibacillus sp.]MCT6923990.1 glycerophosphodiester phosphodiesterase [Metasolibacillus sp.]MCT6940152.1 glycerophosphodiester phosphodiesterase [Metasolibacillus sp.]
MGKKAKVALAIAAASAAVWAGSKAVAKPQKRQVKELLQGKPFIFAHRGGAHLAPEHTLLAFDKAAELGVDGFYVDLRLTKDEEIIAFTDETLERTSTAIGFVKDFTLAELQEINFGEKFEDLEGHKPFVNEHVTVVTLQKLFETYPDKKFILNIQDNPDTYEGSLIPSKLWRIIEEFNLAPQVIVTSPYQEQIDRFNLYAQNQIVLGANEGEATKAYTSFTSQFGHLFNPKVDVFTIPTKSALIAFDSTKFIQFLNGLNVAIFFKEVNDLVAMSRLLRTGSQGIVTDRPDLAQPILLKYKDE